MSQHWNNIFLSLISIIHSEKETTAMYSRYIKLEIKRIALISPGIMLISTAGERASESAINFMRPI